MYCIKYNLESAMKRVNFFFPTQMLGRLKALSEKTGTPAAEILRRALEVALKDGGV
jgi:predicted DNA-binding protein